MAKSRRRARKRPFARHTPASSTAVDDAQAAALFLRMVRALPWKVDLAEWEMSIDLMPPQPAPVHLPKKHRHAFAMCAAEGMLKSFASGEIDRDGLEKAIRRCVLGCDEDFALFAVSSTMARAGDITPQVWKSKRPPFAKSKRPRFASWVTDLSVSVVSMLDEANPGHLTPNYYAEWTSDTLIAALEWLQRLGVFDSETLISPRTLYAWCRKAGYVPAVRRRTSIAVVPGLD